MSAVQYFKIVWTIGYQELQQHFYDCVETADPYRYECTVVVVVVALLQPTKVIQFPRFVDDSSIPC